MRCADCGEEKSPDDFPRHRGKKSGRYCYCKRCHNKRGQETRQRLYGGSRHYHLKQRYGIGAADVERMIREQDGLCALCRRRPAEHVDHDHRTGKVRGILCEPCNGGLGQFKDNVQTIRNAIEYLKNPPARRLDIGD